MTTSTAEAPAKLPRGEDPRNPVHRLAALLDEGKRVVAFCSDATVMGRAMGDVDCRVIVDAYHLAMTDGVRRRMHGNIPL